jgi:pyridoxal phosphate enzyme (YggS family)
MNKYEKNFDGVLSKIEAVRLETNEHQIINIVAISKYVDAPEIESFYKVGQRAFGENKVQDYKTKAVTLDEHPIEWHFVGRIQTNKINALLDLRPTLIHSVDSYELACEIDKKAKVKNQKQNILLQINSAGEDSKAGVSSDDAIKIYTKIQDNLENLTLKGVMSFGANSEDTKEIQKSFETTYKIYEQLQDKGAKYCSMGMSGDFEIAVACGANMLRLGSVLFK